MRPSRVTCVASRIISPAPEYARWPRCTMCQSVKQPSSAEYWHIGEMTVRFGRVMPPRSIGANSSGRFNLDSLLRERFSYFSCKNDCIGLIAVEAERVGGNRHALAREAGDE